MKIMDVQIKEISTGNLIATYPIISKGENYISSKEEYFSEAWSCAVKDKLVKDTQREMYSFSFSN